MWTIEDIEVGSERFAALSELARVLGQEKYLHVRKPHSDELHLIGVFEDARCIGFLRFSIHRLGAEEGRTPILRDGVALREGYVEMFGVVPERRRQGIGQALQLHAIAYCSRQGCYQMRSRSPVTSQENYALKLKMGYAIHPSDQNDSYYFIKTL